MNVKVPNQNVIQFPQVDWKSSKSNGSENHSMAVRESFGEILEREFQVHSEKKLPGSEYKTLGREKEETSSPSEVSKPEDSTKQELNSMSESSRETTATKEQASSEETDEYTEEEDLDRDALEYSLGLVTSHADWDRSMVSANQLNELASKEKTVLLSLQKSAEKTTAYSPKEGSAFIDEAKKLAMNFFQTEKGTKTNDSAFSKSQMPLEKDSNLVLFPKAEKKPVENKKGNEKPESFGVKKESIHSGSVVSDLVFAKGKEVKVEVTELPGEHSVRKTDTKSKTNKPSKNSSENGEISSEQEKSNQTLNSDKMIRSLGVKDKEFQKQDSKIPSASEKQKSVEANLVPNIQTATSSKSGEEGGRSSDERGTKQGFTFTSLESKSIQKAGEIRSTEKQTKPKETNLKQNIDELIKQARFDIVQNGKSSAEIVMNPKEYGRLTLKVTVDGEKVEGRILVESEELQKSLQNEIQTIKENLKESGLDLQALIIDLWDDGSGLTDRKEQNELYQTMVDAAKFRNGENSLGLAESSDLLGSEELEETKVYEFFA
ncbi:flagellar hook-length control protein FliK [Leptospira congkakensis]|uniref:Flagellar hook-length control protein FliK n=1 Tax=Leptospira congkakensis TaxID=2484932 RepID=A0A4Z1A9M5_9LEPT|nr:flagellar hook-length control protein FliK [Leptospira congkakensis]TGL86049.1 flagellar hook-length control protein FliK [Leptospira congkakensis]TGL88923.1 flagellar hook-length control protein FliK [Leptospira congkakensis]TGL93425.1 flagellar hook-length control protein FliK [Leptospira congkakensis]